MILNSISLIILLLKINAAIYQSICYLKILCGTLKKTSTELNSIEKRNRNVHLYYFKSGFLIKNHDFNFLLITFPHLMPHGLQHTRTRHYAKSLISTTV